MLFIPSKVIWVSAVALSLAISTPVLSASAQTGGSGTGDTSNPSNTNSGTMSGQGVDSTRDDRGFDWGWVGLLGLLGLAGLRKPERTQAYRDDANEASRSASRF